jgi:hypothetical protein
MDFAMHYANLDPPPKICRGDRFEALGFKCVVVPDEHASVEKGMREVSCLLCGGTDHVEPQCPRFARGERSGHSPE